MFRKFSLYLQWEQMLKPHTTNLLLVNYEYPPIGGGGGNATQQIGRWLCKKGFKVSVITAAHKSLPKHSIDSGVEVHRIWGARQRLDRCSLFEMLVFLIHAIIVAPRFTRSIKPKATLVFFGLPSGPIGWWIKRIYKIPYVLSLQGGDVPGFMGNDLQFLHWLTKPFAKKVWREASFVVANSDGLAQTARNNMPNIKVDVISAGADLKEFHPRAKPRLPGPVKLLFVGRLVKQKGLDILLNALSQMDQNQDWMLDLIGEGPLRVELSETARQLKILDRITFHGWLNKGELPNIYRTADLFILPSRDEGMPNAMLEAMASGLPVIGSKISGLEEVVIDSETGFLVPPEDSKALMHVIRNLLKCPNTIDIMSQNCRTKMENQYSWELAATAYLKLLTDASKATTE